MSEQNLGAIVRRRETLQVGPAGRTVGFEALTIKDFVEIQRQALAEYRRDLLTLLVGNADLLPEATREQHVRDAFKRAEELSIEKLPNKTIDALGTSMDYIAWWISYTVSGRLHCLWLAARKYPGQADLTLDSISRVFDESPESIANAIQIVMSLTYPDTNTDTDQGSEGNLTRRQRRMQRRQTGR